MNNENKESKKAVVYTHTGLGDSITAVGIVRYMRTLFDEVIVLHYKGHTKNVEMLYSDDPSIKLYPLNGLLPIESEEFQQLSNDCTVFISGWSKRSNPSNHNGYADIPFCFYSDIGIDTDYFWTYFRVPEYKESKEFFDQLNGEQYVFVNNNSSDGVRFTIEDVEHHAGISRDNILVLNSSINIYPENHKYHKLAQVAVWKPILHYSEILKNARHIYLTDSSIFCFAIQLDINTENCYYASTRDYSYLYLSEAGQKKRKFNKFKHA